jgi:hypothetical protein
MVVQIKGVGVKGEVVTLGFSSCGFGSKFVFIHKRIALVAKHVGQAKLREKSCILISPVNLANVGLRSLCRRSAIRELG